MKLALAAIVATIAISSALPASAKEAKAVSQRAALSADELPLTDQFASLLTSYRNCVLAEVEATPLGEQQAMARQAMDACAVSRGALRSQLIADIRARAPKLANAVALKSADGGMAQVDPMIEAAAVDWAHMRYARTSI